MASNIFLANDMTTLFTILIMVRIKSIIDLKNNITG